MNHKYQYIIESQTGTQTVINGKPYLYFAGTGYFQLNNHPEVLKAASAATLKYGIATGTSRAITGTSPLLLEIEDKAATFFDTDDAAYLPSGYLTNIAGLRALSELNLYDVIFLDEGAHYSLVEGVRSVGKPLILFKNRNIADLEFKLKEYLQPNERPVIATDGLFPIKAQIAPLYEYLKIAEQFDGVVWIDDAHGIGILGKMGRGTTEHLGLESERLFMGATLSKAFGAYGGIIPGRSSFIKKVKTGSVLTGSSSPMHAAVAAGIKGLEIVKEYPGLRENLWENAYYLKEKLATIGIETESNCLPIVAFTKGNFENMAKIHQALMDKGIYIQLAQYKGSGNNGILRIVVFASHTKEQIDRLVAEFGNAI